MLNARILKWIDFVVQISILIASLSYVFVDFFFAFKLFFFGLGFWQLGSFFTDLYLRWKLNLSHGNRRKYSIQLIVALLFSLIAFSIYNLNPLISIAMLLLFILYSIALATYYLIISYRELKLIDEQTDRNDLLDLNN